MADGGREDSSVLRCDSRTGPRRELSWAMEVLSQFSSPLSRTRSGKHHGAPVLVFDRPKPKRKKLFDGGGPTNRLSASEVSPLEGSKLEESVASFHSPSLIPNKKLMNTSVKALDGARASLVNGAGLLAETAVLIDVDEESEKKLNSDLDSDVEIVVETHVGRPKGEVFQKLEHLDKELMSSKPNLNSVPIQEQQKAFGSLDSNEKDDISSVMEVNLMQASSKETLKTINCDSNLINENGSGRATPLPMEKTIRRFTRSALKPSVERVGRNRVNDANFENHIAACFPEGDKSWSETPEYPTRRITRSLTKATFDDDATSSGAIEAEGKECTTNLDGSFRTTPKKKMELKMSKKIALTKPPSSVGQLLATGLLDGMRVMYFSQSLKEGLEGVVRKGGILCSCSSCQGTKIISAYHFELHAGSKKKNPAQFIFLVNGKSMQDILESCVGASVDTLETTIQNAVGLPPPKKPVTCKKCQGEFYASLGVKFQMLCDNCLETERLESTPSSSMKTPMSSSRSVLSKSISERKFQNKNSVESNKKITYGKLTKKDVRLHKLVFVGNVLPSGTEVGYYIRGKRLLEGYIKDAGIFCRCCNCVITPSQFESHAGQASRKKPYNNIYTSNGVSLHELSVSLSKDRKLSMNENDDLCSICADGGELLVCDLCPRVFHVDCVGLSEIPQGDWYCKYCESLHQREKCLQYNDNALAAGRVAGVDPIEQIFKRCIRIVETKETEQGGCVLCRTKDYGKSKFGPRTVLLCDQCEKEYHIGCLKDHNMDDLQELPKGEWFCCSDCSRIHAALKDVFLHGERTLEASDIDSLRKSSDETTLNLDSPVELRWRLLYGKSSTPECKWLLSKAVSIFHECFDPIVDTLTGRDLIPSMVYGRSMRYQDFGGMYCALLTLDSSVVSACILRVMGNEIAELPLAATHRESQGKGYFKILFTCIERMLRSLSVKHFVLPAADEVESIWTKKFGFSKVTNEELKEYAKDAFLTTFSGTSLLHKALCI